MSKLILKSLCNSIYCLIGSGNLLLIAMDEGEKDRPRIVISAQLNQKDHTYRGQFMTDFGGNELQLDNGMVSCILK